VHSNFDTIVLDTTKDVLVFAHNPTDHQSETVLPLFKKLAEELKIVDGLVLGEFDVTENEHDHIHGVLFPKFVFFGKNNKYPEPSISLEPVAELGQVNRKVK
jgi:hypothetical protein